MLSHVNVCKVIKYVFIFLSIYFLNQSVPVYAQDSTQDDALDFIVMQAGSTPQQGSFEGFKAYLLEHPEFVEAISKRGFVRIVINASKGSADEQTERKNRIRTKIQEIFDEVGLSFEQRGKRRNFLFNPIGVHFIPVNVDAEYKKAQTEVQEAFSELQEDLYSPEADRKIKEMFSEFECKEAGQCVQDSFKKLLTAYEIISTSSNIAPDGHILSTEEKNDMLRDEMIELLTKFEPQDRIKVLQVLSSNFFMPVSNIIKVFKLQDLEGIDMDVVSQLESEENIDSTVETDSSAATNTNSVVTNVKNKKSIFSTIWNTMVYLPITLIKSLRIPGKDLSLVEILQGLAPKLFPLLATIGVYRVTYANSTFGFWAATSLSTTLDVFHGAEASGWADFQSRIKQDKGELFQANFNKCYGWVWAFNFRLIGYAAGTIPTVFGITSGLFSVLWLVYTYTTGVIGAHVGSRGYNALNELHYKQGVISKQTRDFIQQYVRDLFLVLLGALIGTGGEKMPVVYITFATSLLLDQYLWIKAQTTEQAPILIIGEHDVVESGELKSFYPYLKEPDKVIPLRTMSLSEALRESARQFAELPGFLVAPAKNFISKCVGVFSYPPQDEGQN